MAENATEILNSYKYPYHCIDNLLHPSRTNATDTLVIIDEVSIDSSIISLIYSNLSA